MPFRARTTSTDVSREVGVGSGEQSLASALLVHCLFLPRKNRIAAFCNGERELGPCERSDQQAPATTDFAIPNLQTLINHELLGQSCERRPAAGAKLQYHRSSSRTPNMPRTLVYSIALLAFLGGTLPPLCLLLLWLRMLIRIVTAMTIASIFVPNWISYSDTTPSGDRVVHHIGLHKSYSSTDGAYKHFPNPETCAMDRYFCSMWRSVGFLTSFAAVAELVTLVSFVMVLTGGKQQRESGWKVICYLLTLVALIQLSSMSIVVGSFPLDAGWAWANGAVISLRQRR